MSDLTRSLQNYENHHTYPHAQLAIYAYYVDIVGIINAHSLNPGQEKAYLQRIWNLTDYHVIDPNQALHFTGPLGQADTDLKTIVNSYATLKSLMKAPQHTQMLMGMQRFANVPLDKQFPNFGTQYLQQRSDWLKRQGYIFAFKSDFIGHYPNLQWRFKAMSYQTSEAIIKAYLKHLRM